MVARALQQHIGELSNLFPSNTACDPTAMISSCRLQFEEMYEQKRKEVNKAAEKFEKQLKAAKKSGSKANTDKACRYNTACVDVPSQGSSFLALLHVAS